MTTPPIILTLNGGSSTIKFAAFHATTLDRLFSATIDRVHSNSAQSAPKKILSHLNPNAITAIGHRIVHGGLHLLDHQLITPKVLKELHRTIPIDPLHLPREIALIESFQKLFPKIPQVTCFDTAFHKNLPPLAQLLPIPHKYTTQGLRRFGFHGLSYTYLMQKLQEISPREAKGKIILAHLGSGASMAAVKNKQPIDTTMSFTPLAGLLMATRPGDLDPGLLTYLMQKENLSPHAAEKFLTTHCGLQGIAGISDMRDLEKSRHTNPRAQLALSAFSYQAAKHIAALTTTMNGLDTLIFSAGIGEHSPYIRQQITTNLTHLGIHLDKKQNKMSSPLISSKQSTVQVRVIPTNEELIIAQTTKRITTHSKN